MRALAIIFGLALVGCALGLTPPSMTDASSDASSIDAPACKTYDGAWQTTASSFETNIAPTTRVDFETRGDGVTSAPVPDRIPRDEYLACCGIELDFIGPPNGALIWTGNPIGGFLIRASCGTDPCPGTVGVRVTFSPPSSAVGFEYAGGTNAAVFDTQDAKVSTTTVVGSGINFLGYKSQVPLKTLEVTNIGGVSLGLLTYHACR